jgi:hypothetical protein
MRIEMPSLSVFQVHDAIPVALLPSIKNHVHTLQRLELLKILRDDSMTYDRSPFPPLSNDDDIHHMLAHTFALLSLSSSSLVHLSYGAEDTPSTNIDRITLPHLTSLQIGFIQTSLPVIIAPNLQRLSLFWSQVSLGSSSITQDYVATLVCSSLYYHSHSSTVMNMVPRNDM